MNNGRTISSAHWNAALEAWREGEFSDEWKPFRHQAAMRGMVYPPVGSKWDSWEDDNPSQRAMLVRAIRESPTLLRHIIERSRSWNDVIRRLVKARDEWRERNAEADRDLAFDREREPTQYEDFVSLARIVARIKESS